MDLEYKGYALSEADAVVGVEEPDVAWFQAGVVDEGAVFAAEIMQDVALTNTGNLGMATRDGAIIDR